jgi:RNA polymerase sigma-70 factor (sigma-E family)
MAVSDAEFSEFVAARWSALYRTAYLLSGDRTLAEELAQDSLTRVYAARGRVESVGRLEAYTRRTIAHQYVSEVRRQVAARTVPLDTRPPADLADQVTSREALRGALDQLPAGQRAVVVLRFFDDLSIAETAQTLGCSIGAVKKQTHRALAALEQVAFSLDTENRTAPHA